MVYHKLNSDVIHNDYYNYYKGFPEFDWARHRIRALPGDINEVQIDIEDNKVTSARYLEEMNVNSDANDTVVFAVDSHAGSYGHIGLPGRPISPRSFVKALQKIEYEKLLVLLSACGGDELMEKVLGYMKKVQSPSSIIAITGVGDEVSWLVEFSVAVRDNFGATTGAMHEKLKKNLSEDDIHVRLFTYPEERKDELLEQPLIPMLCSQLNIRV